MRAFLVSIYVVVVSMPLVVFGADTQTYVPLAGVPLVDSKSPTVVGYLNALFTLSIAVAAIFAMFRIVMAGFKYMMASDSWGSKEEAKSDITAVITGLVVLLLSFIILAQINPELVKLTILQAK